MAIKTSYIISAAAVIISLQALILYFVNGNSLICPCGYVKLWDGTVQGPQNSQHILDWYVFSHIIYGFVLYYIFWLLRKNYSWLSIGTVFLLVLLASAGWEIFENTHYAVRQFQANTISFQYQGDSVINSVLDTVWIAAGFYLAFALPVWLVIIIAIGLELLTAYFIRDNFLLSVIMFVSPSKYILQWQAAIHP